MDASIIVPAYNEEKRIVPFLTRLLSYCSKNLKSYELICVDDGSKDRTSDVIRNLIKGNKNAKLISYHPNQGKANAVKTGVFAAKGKKVLFIDADGSIPPEEIPKMLKLLDMHQVVVGNRSSRESQVEQPPMRKLTSFLFNNYVKALFLINVDDMLCGFKGFKKEVARDLFSNLISSRWIFDVELLYKIRKKGYSLYQLPIRWEHKDNTKFKLLDPLKMAFQLLALRYNLIKNG